MDITGSFIMVLLTTALLLGGNARAGSPSDGSSLCHSDWSIGNGPQHELDFAFIPKGCSTEGGLKKDCYIARARASKTADWDLGEGVIMAGGVRNDYCIGAQGVGTQKRIVLFSGSAQQGEARLICENASPIAIELVPPSGNVERCELPRSFP